MENFNLLSKRLEWAIERKNRLSGLDLKQFDIVNLFNPKISRTAVSNWFNDKNSINAKYSRTLADFLEVNVLWLESNIRKPEIVKKSGNHVKNTSLKELTTSDPLHGMANKLAEVFLSLSEHNRELLQLLANKMYEHDQPTDARANGKKAKSKEIENQ